MGELKDCELTGGYEASPWLYILIGLMLPIALIGIVVYTESI